MATRKATRKSGGTTRKTTPAQTGGATKTAVQEALQITWVLNGHIKRAQLAYIQIGCELAEVRDRKLYEALHHPNMEDYAQQRLQLGRSSLYSYLQVHDWIVACHKEWLEPKPKGFIPDLSHAADLMQIEQELAKPSLDAKKRAELTELRAKGAAGTLSETDFAKWRRRGSTPATNSLKSYLTALRRLRNRGAKWAHMPPEVLANLDSAITLLDNQQTLLVAGFTLPNITPDTICGQRLLA